MGVYTILRERRLALAVLASGLVGAIVDSAVFLLLAFGNLAYLEGPDRRQAVGLPCDVWASHRPAPAGGDRRVTTLRLTMSIKGRYRLPSCP